MFRSTRAFTLIELLVVIAIIAILAAILFPVFAEARAKGREIRCLSNEKQIAQAMLMYAQDHDGQWADYCSGYSPQNTCPDGIFWLRRRNYPTDPAGYLLEPYMKNTEIHVCPVQRGLPFQGFSSPVIVPNYAMNALDSLSPDAANCCTPPDFDANTGAWRFTGPAGRNEAQFTHPATFIIIWEHNNPEMVCNTWSSNPAHWDASHHQGFNAAFADGHVKRWTLGKLTNQLVCFWDLPE